MNMVDPREPLALPRPVAFAFSGGSSLGAIQVGMLAALEEHGVAPDLLVGTSVGAINAAFMGSGFTPERVADLSAVWSRVHAMDLFGPPGLRRLIAALRERGALTAPDGLRGLLERHLPRRQSDLRIPTAVVATDLLTGDPVVLEEGALHENVLASAAIPGIFPAVEIGGRTLADGGLSAQVPVLQALALGAASVVVLDAGYPCALKEAPRGLVPNVVHAASLVLRHQSLASLRLIGPRATVVYLPSPCPLGVAPWDFSQWASLVERGHRHSSRFLAGLGSPGPGVHGHPHVHEGGGLERASPLAQLALAGR